ncbi:hypothetical protein PUN28_001503 [Cardiocondyla obscurior]|uniref:Uncharacterized protein n=1 Tax=Cardiocondyla obscurior TaxID=286306 RepID=A0AAW2H5C1_9HYME
MEITIRKDHGRRANRDHLFLLVSETSSVAQTCHREDKFRSRSEKGVTQGINIFEGTSSRDPLVPSERKCMNNEPFLFPSASVGCRNRSVTMRPACGLLKRRPFSSRSRLSDVVYLLYSSLLNLFYYEDLVCVKLWRLKPRGS